MADLTADPILTDSFFPASGTHPSPLFDYLTAFAPRKLKDLFRLTEFLFYNSAQIYAAISKFAIYPITDINFISSTNESLKERYKRLHEKSLKTKRTLMACAVDKFVYGNSFVSVYMPFVRFLQCGNCKHLTNINQIDYEFKLKRLAFVYDCPSCNTSTNGTIIDRKITRPDKVHIIRWDPKLTDIDYNPVTGHSKYFFTIPKELKEKITKGNKHLINTMPIEFLRAIRDDKIFEFAEGQVFHMKFDAPAGIEAQWGMPPLASTVKLFFFAHVLRKANEAIALDYVVPMRIVSPKQTSANADPVTTINLQNWTAQLKDSVKKWRRDPLHILWSPVTAEVTHLGGQARALMTIGEIQAAEENIIAALGIPKEMLYGGLTVTGSAVSLRMLENQLQPHVSDLNELLQWITDRVGKILGWPRVEVELAKFKLIDDVQQKQLTITLNQNPEKQLVSDETIMDLFGYDLEEERKKRKQNALDEIRFNQELQQEIQQMQNTLAQRVQTQMMMGQTGGLGYDQQAVLGQAAGIVQQLMGMDPGTRKSQLDGLHKEDAVMYAVVKEQIEEAQKQEQTAALQQVRQQGGGAPMGAMPLQGGPTNGTQQ